ncbi:MAG: hypothetical protein M5U01_29780 [Ardenticatenaceae bacterium]|nr:hypothetical protein [Ardenticatenaceae bacterium]
MSGARLIVVLHLAAGRTRPETGARPVSPTRLAAERLAVAISVAVETPTMRARAAA